MHKYLFFFSCLLLTLTANPTWSQGTLDSLRTSKDSIDQEIQALKKRLKPLESKSKKLKRELEIIQGWQTGVFGTLGFNQSTFNNWIKGRNPNATSSTISSSINAFANKRTTRSFWKSGGLINLGWQKLDIDTEEGEDTGFERTADVLKITTLYGRNFTSKLALSAQGEYNTALLSNINNPGVLDLGLGVTWNPESNLSIVINPFNYHWVFGDNPEFDNALGMKLTVDYLKKFFERFTWRSSLTGFLPYESRDPSLREYTWINALSFTALRGIGVGLEYALRRAEVEFDGRQSYFVVGLSYAL